jgi:hypothetical protein
MNTTLDGSGAIWANSIAFVPPQSAVLFGRVDVLCHQRNTSL